jgi:hypothetical protein
MEEKQNPLENGIYDSKCIYLNETHRVFLLPNIYLNVIIKEYNNLTYHKEAPK